MGANADGVWGGVIHPEQEAKDKTGASAIQKSEPVHAYVSVPGTVSVIVYQYRSTAVLVAGYSQ